MVQQVGYPQADLPGIPDSDICDPLAEMRGRLISPLIKISSRIGIIVFHTPRPEKWVSLYPFLAILESFE
jgi:hypothetical protein